MFVGFGAFVGSLVGVGGALVGVGVAGALVGSLVGVTVGLALIVGVGVLGTGVGVSAPAGVGVTLGEGSSLGVGSPLGLSTGVGDGSGESVGVGEGSSVGTLVGSPLGEIVPLIVPLTSAVGVGVSLTRLPEVPVITAPLLPGRSVFCSALFPNEGRNHTNETTERATTKIAVTITIVLFTRYRPLPQRLLSSSIVLS